MCQASSKPEVKDSIISKTLTKLTKAGKSRQQQLYSSFTIYSKISINHFHSSLFGCFTYC